MSRAREGGRGSKFPAPFAALPKEGIWAGAEKQGSQGRGGSRRGVRTRASCQGALGVSRVRVERSVGPGVPYPAPGNPMGICGNPSQLSPVSDTWGTGAGCPGSLLSGGLAVGVQAGSGLRVLGGLGSSPRPAPVLFPLGLRSYNPTDSRVLAAAPLLLLLLLRLPPPLLPLREGTGGKRNKPQTTN